jgi:hypothetical protein
VERTSDSFADPRRSIDQANLARAAVIIALGSPRKLQTTSPHTTATTVLSTNALAHVTNVGASGRISAYASLL